MITFALAVLLLLASLVGVTLEKTIFYLSPRELKRRAKRGDTIAQSLYTAAIYGGELRLLLVLVTVLVATGGILLFDKVAPWPFGVIVVAAALALDFFWQPRVRLTAMEARFAAWCAPALAWLMTKIEPAAVPMAELVKKIYVSRRHTGLFERSDLADLLERQAKQRDNRMSTAVLQQLKGLLQLDDLTAKELMVPRNQVVMVNEETDMSPVYVDELHRSGHRYFPVFSGRKSNVVGVLALDQVANVRQHGKASEHMDSRLIFVHERDNLPRVLRAFYETGQHLFIVVDQDSVYSGVISINDVLRKLVGTLDEEAFGKYDDRDAVAARHR